MDALVAPRIRVIAVLGALTLAILLAGVGSAHAASVIGPGGQVSSCYVKKGKAKGTLRVVPPGKRCKRNEKPLTLSAQGQPGQAGQTGQTGGQGGSGETSKSLETRVTQLESILSGITNIDLLSTIGSVDSLCAEVPTVVGQLNSVRTVLSGLSLTAPLLALGSLVVPALPAALPAFACP
jgi:hypothetical protein